MRIVIADDHAAVRQGVRELLEEEPGFSVISEAKDGIEAVERSTELQPDILVTDLKMPGLDGIQVTERVRKSSPKTRVIILSMYSNKSYVLRALNAGANGYVLKNSSTYGIVESVLAVYAGNRYLSPSLEQAIDG